MDRQHSDQLGSNAGSQSLALLAISALLLAWRFQSSPAETHRVYSEQKESARAIILTVFEGVFLTTLLFSRHDHFLDEFVGAWAGTVLLSYLAGLYTLRQMLPEGLSHAQPTALYHSLWSYAFLWATAMLASNATLVFTASATGLLVTALILPRLPLVYDANVTDPTGQSTSSVFGLLSFGWMDNMLFRAWRAGALKPGDIPGLNMQDTAATNMAEYKKTRSVGC